MPKPMPLSILWFALTNELTNWSVNSFNPSRLKQVDASVTIICTDAMALAICLLLFARVNLGGA